MKATELRLNNYVLEDGQVVLLSTNYDLFKCLVNVNRGIGFEPIPLTEEWLLKFGFEVYKFDHKENQYRFKDRLIVIRDNLFYDYGTGVIIKHVHQLQNLYFALTGEELKSNN